MNDIIIVQIIDCVQDFLDCPCRIFFCEFAVLTDAVKQFASSRELRDDVVFILFDQCSASDLALLGLPSIPLTQTNHEI